MHPLRRLSAVARRALPCIVVLGLLSGCGRSASGGDELVVPEPAATRFSGTAPDADVPGPFEVSAAIDYRYEAIPGTLNVNDDGSRADTYPVDMDVLGVIRYPLKALGLCAGITGARYTTTTEVYPDSPRATPEQCNEAQAVAVKAAVEFVLAR